MLRAAFVAVFFLFAGGTDARAQPAGPRTLTTSAEVRALSREQSAQGISVLLRGVVTFSNGANGFTIADGSGIWVMDLRGATRLQPGDLVEVIGRQLHHGVRPFDVRRNSAASF